MAFDMKPCASSYWLHKKPQQTSLLVAHEMTPAVVLMCLKYVIIPLFDAGRMQDITIWWPLILENAIFPNLDWTNLTNWLYIFGTVLSQD